jgi:hypothetical protein
MRFYRLIILFFAVALVPFCYWWKGQTRAVAHQTGHTRLDLSIISQAIRDLEISQTAALSRSSLSNLNASRLYELLSATNRGVRVLEPRYDWDTSRMLLDRWRRPFRVSVTFADFNTNGLTQPRTARLAIWSTGPNGIDEAGTGDDISTTVDVCLTDRTGSNRSDR